MYEQEAGTTARVDGEVARLPFGADKGTPVTELSDGRLENALEWCRRVGRFPAFQAAAEREIHRRFVAVLGGDR